jgi:hypothetical protein
MTDALKLQIYRTALMRIAEWPANSNSEPDVMGTALARINRVATVALTLVEMEDGIDG